MSKFQFYITEEDLNIPIKKLVKKKFGFSSRFMSKLKYQHLIFLDGISIPGWVTGKVGELVEVKLPEEKSDFPPEDIKLNIAYEDDDMIILNKQAGVTVHPTNGRPNHTLANGLMKYMLDTNQSFKIRFINRLDMDTTGLLIVGKHSYTQDFLTKEMSKNKVKKKYLAICDGIVKEDEFTINAPIGKPSFDFIARGIVPVENGGQDSITHIKVIERFENNECPATLIELELETGRTHQIRVHMSSIGHPLLGDNLYGGSETIFNTRQALHAYYLKFIHPLTKETMEINVGLPDDLKDLIKKLEELN